MYHITGLFMDQNEGQEEAGGGGGGSPTPGSGPYIRDYMRIKLKKFTIIVYRYI